MNTIEKAAPWAKDTALEKLSIGERPIPHLHAERKCHDCPRWHAWPCMVLVAGEAS